MRAPDALPRSVALAVAVGAAAAALAIPSVAIAVATFAPLALLLLVRSVRSARSIAPAGGALLPERWRTLLWRALPIVAVAVPAAAPGTAGLAIGLLVLALCAGAQALRLLGPIDATGLGVLLVLSAVEAAYAAAVEAGPLTGALAVGASALYVATLVPAVLAVERRAFAAAVGGRAPGVRRLAVDREASMPPPRAIASTAARILVFGLPFAILLGTTFSVVRAQRPRADAPRDVSRHEPTPRDRENPASGPVRRMAPSIPALESFRSGARTGPRLGFVAQVKRDPRPALRVRVEEGRRFPGVLTLKGGTYDVFTGDAWERSAASLASEDLRDADDGADDGWIRTSEPRPGGEPWRLRVTDLIGGPTGTLFLLPEAARVRLAPRGGEPSLRVGADGWVASSTTIEPGQTYEEQAVRALPDRETLLAAASTRATSPWASCVEAPPDAERLRALALVAVGDATSAAERAERIATYLRTRFEYTLAVPDLDPRRPVSDFLFRAKRGHCEYFAASMTLLMRSLGHPARLAVGFRGGDLAFLETLGEYSFRGSDAHAWTEVHFEDVGWIAYDPTPPDSDALEARGRSGTSTEGEDAAPGFFGRLARWSDEDREWLRERVGGMLAGILDVILRGIRSPVVFVAIALLLLAVPFLRAARARHAGRLAAGAAAGLVDAYRRAVLALRSAGVVRPRSHTATEFAGRAARAVPPAEAPFRGLTHRFEEARYGGRPPTTEGIRAAESEADAVAEAAARRRS